MRNIIITIMLFASFYKAIAHENIKRSWGIGYLLCQNKNDFGLGLQLLSPTFINNQMRICISGNIQWFEAKTITGLNYQWYAYNTNKIGVQWRYNLYNNITVYSEGGMVGLIPNKNITNRSIIFGGYGTFGVEFYMMPKFCYFFESGTFGINAIANNVYAQPRYSNGFTVGTGFRIML